MSIRSILLTVLCSMDNFIEVQIATFSIDTTLLKFKAHKYENVFIHESESSNKI